MACGLGGTPPIVDFSFAPELYFYGMQRVSGKKYSSVLVIVKNGVAQGYLPELEYERLGNHLSGKFKKLKDAKRWANEFMQLADKMYAIIEMNPENFLKKWQVSKNLYGDFGAYAEATKTVFDVSGERLSPEIKKILADSRKYSEDFYSQSRQAYVRAADWLKKPVRYQTENILNMTRQELIEFIKTKKLPSLNELQNRHKYCGVYFLGNKIIFLNRKEVKSIEAYWLGAETRNELSGTIAFKGKVKGRCKIIKNFKGADIKKGEILVTGMTNPNFVPLMKKSGAIVTDGGGLLSHAAIVARELKKPCIIGTKIATQVLKDGDLVEVDANKGIVKIIKTK